MIVKFIVISLWSLTNHGRRVENKSTSHLSLRSVSAVVGVIWPGVNRMEWLARAKNRLTLVGQVCHIGELMAVKL